jgi:mono/diheme cytochrome c family protein
VNKVIVSFLIVLTVISFSLVACGSANQTAPEGAATSLPTPPPEYADRTDPYAGQINAVTAGEKIYQSNCSSCHGDKGKGDGPVAMSLDPKPANLAANMSSFSDAYLFWRINEGGQFEPFHSVMPAWKNVLSEEQIWQVISFLRTLGN